MVTARRRLIAAEIALVYGRALTTVQTDWMPDPGWPVAVGRRGRWNEYDAGEVHAYVLNKLLGRQLDDDPLLTRVQAAEIGGWADSTIRAYISQGRWPAPDDERDGVPRWRYSTVTEFKANQRTYRRRA